MGGWNSSDLNVGNLIYIFCFLFFFCKVLLIQGHFYSDFDISPSLVGFGVKASPTAIMGETKTVWSFGTAHQASVIGMMRTVILNKTGSVRCIHLTDYNYSFPELWNALGDTVWYQ